jgi:hypothetical protein
MDGVDAALARARSAIDAVIAAADQSTDSWTTPRAPGKWSPSQVVEHVAMSVEDWGHMAAGASTRFPNMPFFLKPILRTVFFQRVLRNDSFPKARATRKMTPVSGPHTPALGRDRLEEAYNTFVAGCRAASARGGKVSSSLFGSVPVEDFIRFQEIHIRHHLKQIRPS